MFFEAGPTGTTPTDPSAGYGGEGAQLDFVESQKKLSEFSNQILSVFTQGRERIYELQNALADATPRVSRLGGNIKDVVAIVKDVAEASGRNVVATTKQIEELYAGSKLLGIETKTLVNNFLDVGISIKSVSEELEESVEYVQSIGGNAKQVMQDVNKNMAQMNRFQFEDGVKGLTKMAAQASMLRFDMAKTFSFADKLLSPEAAIEAAASFQRLGVAVGSLGDPLQLMNQAINDPSGLQDSLIEVAKRFAYFNDETKSFKISQEGILRFKELEETTNISAAEMSKLGLAALEVDKRLSQISPSIKFENEEDKKYLANIARMGDGGEYEVEIRNTQGDIQMKKLSDVTQTEFEKLIKEQKDGEKSLQELTRDQMTLQEIMQNDLAAIRTVVTGGVLTAPTLQGLNEDIRKLTESVTGTVTDELETKKIRDSVEGIFDNLGGKLRDIVMGGDFSVNTIFEKLVEGSREDLDKLTTESLATVTDLAGKIQKEIIEKFGTSEYASLFGTRRGASSGPSGTSTPVTSSTSASPTRLTVEGTQPIMATSSFPILPKKSEKLNVEFGGKIPDINVNFNNAPQGMTPQQIEEWKKIFKSVVNEQYFRNYLIKVYDESGAEVAPY